MRPLFLALFFPAIASADPIFGKTLKDRMELEKSVVCTNGSSHYVAVLPHEKQISHLLYGDGKRFFQVSLPPWTVSGNYFLDPRYLDKSRNPDFRGVDMRLYSSIEVADGVCSVECGGKTAKWKALPPAEASAMLSSLDVLPSPQTREAYALARDQNGVYYYVDRGSSEETKKSFHVYIGPKGALKLQKMKDVVSDSQGEIFAARTGTLRFVLDKESDPVWIAEGKQKKLKRVSVMENLPLIYTELGVYTRQRLETPCEDF